ncbi:beta-galactosidase [Flammeovirgaceae bacterium 311]|nr:beta-galactosidase [Flammeovirgaceae bacterium 311]
MYSCYSATGRGGSLAKEINNANWEFYEGSLESTSLYRGSRDTGEPVIIPLSWNRTDVLDDIPGYHRGVGWYNKMFFLGPSYKRKKLFVPLLRRGEPAD